MQSRFLATMRKFGFPENGKELLVAVSGGVDSMVLAALLHRTGFRMAVAHCNYGLRGTDADADEALVRNWCMERNIPFYSKQVETRELAETSGFSVQMVAREERYRFFEELMHTHRYATTALAHHADDRVESVLMNVLRGTGYRGLQGMPSKRNNYIRPLLDFRKTEIEEFAEKTDVPFRSDASNKTTHYRRNWIRLKLLPMLLAYDSQAVEKLQELGERAEEQLPRYEAWIRQQLEKIGTEERISVERLKQSKVPFVLLKERLEPLGFSSDLVFQVLEILDSTSGKEICSETHRVLKDREQLIVAELSQDEQQPELQFELIDRSDVGSLKTEPNVALLDAAHFGVSNDCSDQQMFSKFKTRKWQQGDRFRPLGMAGWKLLSDFFIDQKLAVPEKNRIWLLTFKGEIVWVISMRLDDRFKITPSTKKVLKIIAA